MGSPFYYLTLAVASLSIGIFNFSVSSSGTGLTCFNTVTMSQTIYAQYLATFSTNLTLLGVASPNALDSTLVDVREPGSNLYSLLTIVIAILYGLIMIFSLGLSLITNMMSNQLPEDFLKMGRLKKFSACFCKVIPPLLILIHWLIMILIILLWVLIYGDNCSYSSTTAVGVLLDPTQYFTANSTLNLVNSAVWVLIHYAGATFREIVYQEPFMYSPDIGTPSCWKSFFFKKLGP